MSKKNYLVLIEAYAHVLVEGAEDEETALRVAEEFCSVGDCEFEGSKVVHEVPPGLLDRERRHANLVVDEEEGA